MFDRLSIAGQDAGDVDRRNNGGQVHAGSHRDDQIAGALYLGFAALNWTAQGNLFSALYRLKVSSAPVRLDRSVGEDEIGKEHVTALANLLDEVKLANVDYRFTVYPGENHNSVRLASFPAALSWVYRPSASDR